MARYRDLPRDDAAASVTPASLGDLLSSLRLLAAARTVRTGGLGDQSQVHLPTVLRVGSSSLDPTAQAVDRTKVLMALPDRPNLRWSMDFV